MTYAPEALIDEAVSSPAKRNRRTPEQRLAEMQDTARKLAKQIAEAEAKRQKIRFRVAGEWLLQRAKTDRIAGNLVAELKRSLKAPHHVAAFEDVKIPS
jgi:hypothetical protein